MIFAPPPHFFMHKSMVGLLFMEALLSVTENSGLFLRGNAYATFNKVAQQQFIHYDLT